MPNTCINELIITGPQEDIERFYAGINAPEGDLSILSTYYPMPRELVIDGRLGWMTPEGQEWQNKHWGSKFADHDANYGDFVNDGEPFTAVFCTAWTPCNNGFIEVSKQFPTLTFHIKWIEPGCGRCGTLNTCNGNAVENERDVTAKDLEEFNMDPADFSYLGV